MSLTLLRAADRVATPWKNGGGVTREVAAWPPGAGLDDFAWRVSLAEIRTPGPFSAFPGVDRIFAVLEGRLRLTVEGAATVLSPDDPPLAFPGEAAVSAEPLDGPTLDLNVMTRRGGATAAVRRIAGGHVAPAAGTMMVLALGPSRIRCDREDWKSLARYDAALIEPPCALAVEGEAWAISVAA